jgi:predicted ester cyclase
MASRGLDAASVARAFYESYNQKDLDASFEKYIAKDLINHSLDDTITREGWLAGDKPLFPVFADFSLTVFDQVAEGDKVATRFQFGGKQTREFMGIPASGNVAFLHMTTIDRIEHGQIVEHWADFDLHGWFEKLSARPDAASVARAFYESYNQKNLDASFEKYIAKDLINHAQDDTATRDAWLAGDKTGVSAFADFSLTVFDQVAEGNKVATRFQTGGKQTGEFMGIPASGNVAFLHSTAIDRIEHSQIVEHWADYDLQGWLEKLSASPTSK